MAPKRKLSDTINVRIGLKDERPLRFKIERVGLLNEVFKMYREMKKIYGDNLKFRDIKGMQLSGFETPASLGMKENDLIVAFFQEDISKDKFHVRIGLELDFTIDRYLMLKRLFNEYADRTGFKLDGLQFFDENGNQLKGTDSPGSLNMAQNALIRAVMQPQETQSYEADNDGDETIQLKVFPHWTLKNSQQDPLHFRFKRSMPLRQLFQAYADRIGIEFNNLEFVYEGKQLWETVTPASLEMESGDQIVACKAM